MFGMCDQKLHIDVESAKGVKEGRQLCLGLFSGFQGEAQLPVASKNEQQHGLSNSLLEALGHVVAHN